MSRKLLAPSDSICRWEDIDFRIAEYRVKKLQKQIATAYKCNNSKTVVFPSVDLLFYVCIFP